MSNERNETNLETAIMHLNNIDIETVRSVDVKGQRYLDDSESLVIEIIFKNHVDADRTIIKTAMQIQEGASID